MTKNQRIFHVPLPIILPQEINLRKKDYINSLYMTKKTEHVEIVHNINFTKRLKDESNQRAFSDIK
jgi:hypothetical protein